MKRRGKCNVLPFRVPLSDAAPHVSRSSRRRQPAADLDGKPCGEITPQEAQCARVQIANLDLARQS
jgi:hypothetical protein